MKLMFKIAVFGERESIKGFAAIGLDIFPCDSDDTAAEQFKKLVDAEYGVIYITEHFASLLSREIEKTDARLTPSVIPIPGALDNTGIGVTRLKSAVEKAVGSDIIFDGR